ncbi:DUF6276 family protein [Salinigranum marinum]|uniref:DUF6276 family protein n=1 Tax=Salinigranum marinum TaxID=1515595 RepID=UPI002989E0C5|nr:DUF6276 family protein [Salinigranum marinum]
MACSACGGGRVTFAVPASLRPYAPDESPHAALCTTCLRVTAVDDASAGSSGTADAAAVDWGPLPSGEAGVATALLLGLLDSLALRRADVTALVDHAEAAGGDPLLALDRLSGLASSGEIDPEVALDRRTAQLQSLLG